MAVGMSPRLEVIADDHAVKAAVFCSDGELHKLARGKLLCRRLVSELEHFCYATLTNEREGQK